MKRRAPALFFFYAIPAGEAVTSNDQAFPIYSVHIGDQLGLQRGGLVRTRTSTQFVEDLRDPANASAWSTFERRYRSLLIAFAHRLGASAEDAADAAQQAMVDFAAAIRDGRYDRQKGKLSSWLIAVVQNRVFENHRRAHVRHAAGDTALAGIQASIPDEADLTRIWQAERQAVVLALALEILRQSPRMEEHTMRVFELYTIRDVPAEEVASQCGVEVETVYVVKNRLTKRLREIIQEITRAFDEDG